MKPYVILTGASLLCFGSATIVSTLIAYTNPVNPLGFLLLQSLSSLWQDYLACSVSRGISYNGRSRLRLRVSERAGIDSERGSKNSKRNTRQSVSSVSQRRSHRRTGRSPQERVTESLTEVQTQYVDGHLTECEFEEELTTLLEIESEIEYS